MMRRPLQALLLIVAQALIACAAVAQHAAPPVFQGPFEMRQFLVFHVINPTGEAFQVNLNWEDDQRRACDRPILVRVFDPDEHVLIHHDEPGAKVGAGEPTAQSAMLEVPAAGAGVYQVAITGFSASIDFVTEPQLSYGLYGYPDFAFRDDQFANAFVYLPPGLDALTARTGEGATSLTLTTDRGERQMNVPGVGGATVALPASGEHIWQLSAVANGVGTLTFAGMPIVLCPNESSARAIHASVDVLDDGTVCFHKFQVRAHEILKRYRAMPPSAFAVQAPVMIRQKRAWLADPMRNQLLLGPYGVFAGLEVVLAEQDIVGASPWFGCIHAQRDGQGRTRSDNPWTTYTRLGLTRAASTLGTLAAVYSVREPFNPLAGDDALRNRIVIAAMQEIMMLREHELPLPEFIEYQGGVRAFTIANFTLAFPLVVRECPDDVRVVWTEGLRRYVDHESISQVGNTCNQWSFIIRAIQQFREGIDDAWYGDLLQRHVRWLLERNQYGWGFMPAGYFAESGPDSSYVGITLHNLGWVCRRTGDVKLRAALACNYDLFNHTVVPEPDGTWIGATSFCSRVPDDWSKPQFTAGVNMLVGEIAEAVPLVGRAWLSQPAPSDLASLCTSEQALTGLLRSNDRDAFDKFGEAVMQDAANIGFASWQCFAEHPLQGRLPVQESDTFTRAFGDEFMCVRRPSYYAFLYAGSPMADWQQRSRAHDARKQYPRNGGGLCMFWSPVLGSSLIGKNWSTEAAQTIFVERDRATGALDWEDYWSVEPKFDIERSHASITSTLLNQPVRITRHIDFENDAVRCDVSLTVDAAIDAKAMWECFPYTLDKARPLEVALLDDHGRVVRNGNASAILFSNGSAESHLIVFSQPRRCEIGAATTTDNYGRSRTHGRVLAEIAGGLQPGVVELQWRMMAVPASQIPAHLAEAMAELQQPIGD